MTVKFRWETKFQETEFGEIPKDWAEKEISTIGKVITGKTPPTKENKYWNADIPFITPTDILDYGTRFSYKVERYLTKEWLNKARSLLIPPKSVCFVCIGSTIGKVCLSKQESFTNQQINSICINENNDPDFIYYIIRNNQVRIKEEFGGGGAAKDIIKKSIFEKIKIYIPDKNTQSKIAAPLSWFDELIENKKRQNEILEKTAMAIFKSWFINFEPFKDMEFVESELGEIPKGWEVKEIVEYIEFLYGKGFPEGKREEGPYPVVGSSGIVGYNSKYIVSTPSIIIGRKGNAGSVYLLLEPSFPIDTVFYSSKETPLDIVFYIYYYLKNASLEEVGLSDTAVPGLSIHTLNAVKVLIPPSLTLKKFLILIKPLFQKIFFNQKQIMLLSKVRDTLLPLLVFGRLRVEEI